MPDHMTDHSDTLRRIIADVVRAEIRDLDVTTDIDLFRLGDAVASRVLRRIESAGIKAVSL